MRYYSRNEKRNSNRFQKTPDYHKLLYVLERCCIFFFNFTIPFFIRFLFSGNVYALTEGLIFVFIVEQRATSSVGPSAWFEGDFTGSA